MSEGLKECDKLNYAWNWFSYHANQRLLCFNFFIIILGGAGYLLASKLNPIYFILSGFFLVFIAKLFWILEIRNRELVNYGRRSLGSIFNDENINPRIMDEQRSLLEETINNDRNLPNWTRTDKEAINKTITHTYVYDTVYKWTGYIGWILLIIGILGIGIVHIEKIRCLFKCFC
jgi:hypothetical protein